MSRKYTPPYRFICPICEKGEMKFIKENITPIDEMFNPVNEADIEAFHSCDECNYIIIIKKK